MVAWQQDHNVTQNEEDDHHHTSSHASDASSNEDDDNDSSRNNSSSSEEDNNSNDDDDDSSYDSAIDQEAQRLMAVLHGDAAQPTQQTPQQIWDDFCKSLATSTSLKVTDNLVAWITEMEDDDEEEEAERIAATDAMLQDLLRILPSMPVLQHVILGRQFLALLSSQQQGHMFQVIVDTHSANISYWKLGSDDSVEPCGIATNDLLTRLATTAAASWNNLREVEMRGLTLTTVTDVELILQFVQHAPLLRQFNLLGLVLDSDQLVQTTGLLDGLVTTVQAMEGFDELQLGVTTRQGSNNNKHNHRPALVTATTLQEMLRVKPKWWRLALDGLGLDDSHVHVVAHALQSSEACKMNDLLSVRDNPSISAAGLQMLYTVCCNKQRMGLVLSDDAAWVATFDLVRPLNNLHRRLEYKDAQGHYHSRAAWADWLAVVGNLPWIEEARKVNYLWFSLLEQPGLLPMPTASQQQL